MAEWLNVIVVALGVLWAIVCAIGGWVLKTLREHDQGITSNNSKIVALESKDDRIDEKMDLLFSEVKELREDNHKRDLEVRESFTKLFTILEYRDEKPKES